MKSPFVLERPGVAAAYVYMTVEGIIFYGLTLLVEVSCDVVMYSVLLNEFLYYYYSTSFSTQRSDCF